jgi:tRNA pseudouridine32 synthase/23S rRNA pseudouridine746 synthase
MINIPMIFQDDHLVVVNKPSGLLSVPGRTPDLQDCLWKRLQDQFPEREVLLVHRLDRDTSGLIVFAFTREAQAGLGRSFEKRKVEKEYVAWVRGTLERDSGTVEGLMRKDWSRYDKPVYIMDPERGKSSQTSFEVLERTADRTKVLLRPRTGRSHQLRVHMKSLGHPIVGDPIYGPEGDVPPLHLAASRLRFRHPVTREALEFCAPLPDYF